MASFEFLVIILTGLGLTASIIYYAMVLRNANKSQQIRERDRKREQIEKYYPHLAESLRHSIPDIAYTYREGYQKEHGDYLDVLIEMANQSTLSIIESLDEVLYNDLKIILEEYIPKEKELEKRKRESWNEIPIKWKKWLMDNYTEIPMLQKNSDELVNQLANSLLWQLWKAEIPLVNQNFDRIYDSYFILDSSGAESTIGKERILDELSKIAKVEWEPIRKEYEHNLDMLTELIEEKVLPRMTDTLGTLGK